MLGRVSSHAETTAGADRAADRRRRPLAQLEIIVDLYDRGMREPLPLACQASAAYAYAAGRGDDPLAAALAVWETAFGYDKEDRQPEHLLVVRRRRSPFAELTAEPPRADENGATWPDSEDTRFGRYARRLWDGLLGHEELRDR